MENTFLCLLLSVFVFIAVPVNGCTIEGIDNWVVAESQFILDTFRGNIWNRSTSNIQDINGISYIDGLNKGPYVTISLIDSRLVISTNDAFENYEEYETSASMGFTISFRCFDGSTLPFVFQVGINDTNNNDPQFRPSNTYEFTIAPPIPPGFLITNCVDDVIVRDIDLTTERIDFEISGSSLFQITYDSSSTVAKEFKAALRTTTLIRSISEPIILTVTATDVDRTGDPRRTATATITVTADTEFTFPDEPIFSQPFYLATYTEHELILQDSIFLRQGYDDQVVFSFEGQYSQYFDLVPNGNEVYFNIKSPLPVDLYREGQIFLVVIAERNYTSGATATIIVQLPEAINLEFEARVYAGSIEDNKLNLVDLKLNQGYEDTSITVDITSDYKSYFSASVDVNTITLSMAPLSDSIINENNLINLQVTATTASNSSATTTVILEIIKDDITTPIFERNLYTGSYAQETGLNLEQIILIQGYDSTVNITVEGEHSSLFEKEQNGPIISLSMSSLPSELLAERNILVSVRATKPRTVGANTVVQITLPSAVNLEFEAGVYAGSIEDNKLNLVDLKLNQGYEDTSITVDITSDYKSYFSASVDVNTITLSMAPLSDSIINENNLINLQVTATTASNSSATTIVILEIIKDDLTTPIFERNLYTGSYAQETGLNLEQIVLIQGYDSTVNITVEGEHSSLFEKEQNGPIISLSMSSLPSELLAERNILVSVRATKPRTVGANTVVQITLPSAVNLEFEAGVYAGSIEDNKLNLVDLKLNQGYEDTSSITVDITSDYKSYFSASVDVNTITLSMAPLSDSIINENNLINLQVTATTASNSSATTIVILEIIKDDLTTPIFERNLYTGSYAQETGLNLEQIVLIQGYDSTVNITVEGEHSSLFEKEQNGPIISLSMSSLPSELLAERNILVSVRATKPRTVGANTVVQITLPSAVNLEFEAGVYAGSIEDNKLNLVDLKLNQGYEDTSSITVDITSDYKSYFSASVDVNTITLSMAPLSDSIINENNLINLQVTATTTSNSSATTIVILEIIKDDLTTPIFERNLYTGSYAQETGLNLEQIVLIQGYDSTVNITVEGEHSSLFEKEQNGPIISLSMSSLPSELLAERNILVSVRATKPRTVGANTVVQITLPSAVNLEFEAGVYAGSIEDNKLNLVDLKLNQGYEDTSSITVDITSDYKSYFSASVDVNTITLSMAPLSDTIINENNLINLQVTATTTSNSSATTIVILEIIKDDLTTPIFERNLYTGSYAQETGLNLEQIVLIQGYDSTVNITVEGEHSSLFEKEQNGPIISLSMSSLPSELLAERNILVSVRATKPRTVGANTVVQITLPSAVNLEFEAGVYAGSIEDNKLNLVDLKLNQGYEDTSITVDITSDYKSYFSASVDVNTITLSMAPLSDSIINENNLINLQVTATTASNSSATTTVILEIVKDDIKTPIFERNLYTGSYAQETGLNLEKIVLIQGYDSTVNITVEGEHSSLFEKEQNGPIISLSMSSLPSELLAERNILVSVRATKPRTVGANTVVQITLPSGSDSNASVSFDKILYNGNLKDGVLTHETITLSGFTGSNIIISGELATLFESSIAKDVIIVDVAPSATFPENLTYIALTLHADSASAVLILDVSRSDPDLPTVSFNSPSYFLWADINQTGLVGRVKATADNGEAVLYSVTVDDDLRELISINSEGELLLSATVDRGVYNFKVTATAQTSQVSATAPVILRVDALPECSIEDGLQPLIIVQRVEEEPHLNLVILNHTDSIDCWYTITSLWPEDQSWLYIENGGLHAKVIDREHESIAFMIQSQIQAELILHCDNDNDRAIVKRSLATDTGSGLDTYNYGSNKWVLADTITYNARRSVVNLIVEDINDNAPVFVGKENEPIYVGYPIPELENTILPRALIELKATDADIGENAALIYRSMEENLAVSSTTGFIHVRNNAYLENDSRLTVYAIDQNGKGLNGSLDIVIKLLERNQIAVITVRNAFLDDENTILSNLSTSVGYDVKILRTVVISENNEEGQETSRRKREIANTSGASLQLFVYGISGSQLIDVDKLTSDIDQVVSVDKVRVKSLEDHLESLEICPVPGKHIALLASTIVLAVVLLILIVAVTAWFLLKWRKKKKYEQFSDANSLASRIEVESKPQVESPFKPRLDIEELKRSERRLQEMLDAPVPAVVVHSPKQEINQVEEQESSIVKPEETLINITADPQPPIVIQSIDKLKDISDEPEDDEFGETQITKPRKSVVTFNENVEKIIHIEYDIDDNSEPDTEVYRF